MKGDGLSRSRYAMDLLYEYCKNQKEYSKAFKFRYVDLRELKNMSDKNAININNADALVIASPVHNWTVSSELLEYINTNLDDENTRHFRPVMTILGASSTSSIFANEALNRSLITVADSIIVGKPIVITDSIESISEEGQMSADVEDKMFETFHMLASIALFLH